MKKIFISLLFIIPINVLAIEIDKDLNSGIILTADENILVNDTVLSVSTVNNNNVTTAARSFDLTNFNAYNISLLNNATRIIPNGNVNLEFPIPNNYDLNQIFILELDANNNIKRVYSSTQDELGLYNKLTINNNYAIITTNDFSLTNDNTYILGTKSIPITSTTKKTTVVNNPNTYDSNFAPLLIISIVGVGGIMVLLTKLYIDNKN